MRAAAAAQGLVLLLHRRRLHLHLLPVRPPRNSPALSSAELQALLINAHGIALRRISPASFQILFRYGVKEQSAWHTYETMHAHARLREGTHSLAYVRVMCTMCV